MSAFLHWWWSPWHPSPSKCGRGPRTLWCGSNRNRGVLSTMSRWHRPEWSEAPHLISALGKGWHRTVMTSEWHLHPPMRTHVNTCFNVTPNQPMCWAERFPAQLNSKAWTEIPRLFYNTNKWSKSMPPQSKKAHAVVVMPRTILPRRNRRCALSAPGTWKPDEEKDAKVWLVLWRRTR